MHKDVESSSTIIKVVMSDVFASSTMLKILETTTAGELCSVIAHKLALRPGEIPFYHLVLVCIVTYFGIFLELIMRINNFSSHACAS